MTWGLPKSLLIGGKEYEIETDYREILKILVAFEDPELTDTEKQFVCMYNLFMDYESIPQEHLADAFKAAIAFIDNDSTGGGHSVHRAKTMDWEQDASILFPAVNKAAGFEVRAVPYLHWWTFLGFFMEIRDSVYATVLALRQKKAKGKKLEKWEKEYWNSNIDLCKLKPKLTDEEKEEKEKLKAILG